MLRAMSTNMLTVDDVLTVHAVIVREFAESSDPISPSGVRSRDLLESAVARQWTSLGGVLKYPQAVANAATLGYGLCCDHPFLNGNKRTALVAMLVHLDRNQLTLFDTSQNDLYDLMIQIADHKLMGKHERRTRPDQRPSADHEVEELTRWLHAREGRIRRGEKLITYRELRQILKGFGYYLENPKDNSIDIIRYETVKRGFLPRREERVAKRIGSIGWPGEHREIGISQIKKIREICRLREEDGVGSDGFYSYNVVVDAFVNRYRTVLRRLAKV
jgi:death on curing protein